MVLVMYLHIYYFKGLHNRCRIGHDDLLGCCIIGNGSPMPEGRKQWMDCFRNLTINAIYDDSV